MSLKRRFVRDERGATAVEFAIIATPFLALVIGIVELGMLFMASVSLDNSMQAASRTIRTGELKTPAGADATAEENSRTAFRDKICDGMGFMAMDCQSKLTVDVQTVPSFSDIALTNPIQNGNFSPGALHFATGGPTSYVIVRAYYRWNLFMPLMNQGLQKLPGQTLITSVTTFRNEPF